MLQRFLDGHPQLMVYPFESQISTPLSSNILAGPNHWVPQRYSYPEFSTEWTAKQAYHAFWDQELKTYLRTPQISKFKDCGLVMDENQRIEQFEAWSDSLSFCAKEGVVGPYDRPSLVEAFFRSTFDSWSNFARTGRETHHVGYSPPILFDTDKILSDFPTGHVIHIFRNPFSGYADTKKRPFPMSLTKYCQIWNMVQLAALTYQTKYPKGFMLIRFESLVHDPRAILDGVTDWVGLERFPADHVFGPSFNRKPLAQVYPWGTIKHATTEANLATANELTPEEKQAVQIECGPMLDLLGYGHFKREFLA